MEQADMADTRGDRTWIDARDSGENSKIVMRDRDRKALEILRARMLFLGPTTNAFSIVRPRIKRTTADLTRKTHHVS